MAETDNLKLYKADPVADSDKTFNIDTMLNGNWDKIDSKAAEWDGKETPEGAQAKANEALAAAKEYANDKVADAGQVKSVNNKTGDVVLTAADVGAETPTGAQEKASQAEANAKNASLPRSGGTVSGNLAVTNILTVQGRDVLSEIDSAKQAGVDAKQQIVDAINAMGGSASTNDSWATLSAKIKQVGMKWAKGTATVTDFSGFDVTGLTFQPNLIILKVIGNYSSRRCLAVYSQEINLNWYHARDGTTSYFVENVYTPTQNGFKFDIGTNIYKFEFEWFAAG
ncbi:hypothetical protein [Paenibacillus thiaminolyticus]|uniref:Tail fiber protein n=1 Tax=Paenibacillus thiaminolyticus TaxID=49283 RepID=A0A3A3H8Z8_PANTH|nr:hypothetical protein [Paenibacillus thiaminolyticus]RJG26717.1 hypothetical protein DQX05_01405 [Paenibacillus thiaminolyticus]